MISSSGLMTGSRSTSLITDTRVHSSWRRRSRAVSDTAKCDRLSGRRGTDGVCFRTPRPPTAPPSRPRFRARPIAAGPRAAHSTRPGCCRYRPDPTPTTPWPRCTPGRNGPRTPFLRANMIASLDGGSTVDGHSAGLGNAADEHLFAVLRDLADVILVGSGTVRAEGYGGVRLDDIRRARRQRWGLSAAPPPIAVVTGRGLDPRLAAVHRHRDAAHRDHHRSSPRRRFRRGLQVIITGHDRVNLSEAVTALGVAGFGRIHCEGGPQSARRSGGRRPGRRVLFDDRPDAARLAGHPAAAGRADRRRALGAGGRAARRQPPVHPLPKGRRMTRPGRPAPAGSISRVDRRSSPVTSHGSALAAVALTGLTLLAGCTLGPSQRPAAGHLRDGAGSCRRPARRRRSRSARAGPVNWPTRSAGNRAVTSTPSIGPAVCPSRWTADRWWSTGRPRTRSATRPSRWPGPGHPVLPRTPPRWSCCAASRARTAAARWHRWPPGCRRRFVIISPSSPSIWSAPAAPDRSIACPASTPGR